MKEPGIVLEFLQSFRNCRPELAAWAFVDAANSVLGRGNWIDLVSVQLANKRLRSVSYEQISLGGCHRDTRGFGQPVGQIVEAPVGRFLPPTREAQREGADEKKDDFGRLFRN